MYAISFVFDDKVGDHPPFIRFSGFLGDVEDGGPERMLLDALGLEVLDEQKYGDDSLLVGEQLSVVRGTLRLMRLLMR